MDEDDLPGPHGRSVGHKLVLVSMSGKGDLSNMRSDTDVEGLPFFVMEGDGVRRPAPGQLLQQAAGSPLILVSEQRHAVTWVWQQSTRPFHHGASRQHP